jgi:hypothetical protein
MAMLDVIIKKLRNNITQNGLFLVDLHSPNLNAHYLYILHTILLVGLYPMLGTLFPPLSSRQKT